MLDMGAYCRAYYVRDLAAFPGWEPDLRQLRQDPPEDGRPAVPRSALDAEDVLYVQEDLSVTDGIYLRENVVFAGKSEEWRAFCASALAFAPPAGDEDGPRD